MFLKIMKLYREAVSEATGGAYDNLGKRYAKIFAGGVSGILDNYLDQFSVDELNQSAQKITEYSESGKMRQKFDDFFASYSPSDLEKDLTDMIAGLGDDVNSYQVAVIIKRLPKLLPLDTLVDLATKVAENMPTDTMEQQQQKLMMTMAAPVIIGEKVAPVYQMIEQSDVPQIASIVQQLSAQGAAFIAQNSQKTHESYDVMKKTAYEMVEKAEQGKSKDDISTVREIQSTLSKAFKDFASKDADVSDNAFGSTFKDKFSQLTAKLNTTNDNVRRNTASIIKKFKL